MQKYWLFSSKNIRLHGSTKKPDEEKKSKEDEHTFAELISDHRLS